MSEEETKFLNRQRGAVKSKLTLFSNHLRTLEGKSLSEAELINLEERISKADTIFADFDKLQNQIQNVVSESEIESQYQERSIFEDTFFATIARAKQMVLTYKKEHEQQISANASTSGSSNHDENNVQVLKGVKFPVISLPNFDGNMDNWLEFRDTFQSLIHDNGLINNIQKYHYLRACLTNGASQVIRSIELSASNYPVAWETLCERYNNNQLLVHIHTKALFNLEPIQKECASKLRNLLDNVSKHLRSLQQLGEPTDQWDTLINYLVTTKLDSKTTREWEQHKIGKEYTTWDDLKTFLKGRSDMLETVDVKNDNKLSTKNTTKSFHSNASPKCLYCKKDHLIYTCADFLNLTISDRINFISKSRLCTNCLKSGHFEKTCKFGPCRQCNKRHNTLLHLKNTSSSEQRASESDSTTGKHQISLSATNDIDEVLLSTACVQVLDKFNNPVTVRALLDCGSQSSFITHDLSNLLDLEKHQMDITVTGLNQSCSRAQYKCNIFLQSCDGKFNTQVNCLIIPRITSDLPNIKINKGDLNIPKNIGKLADPNFNKPGEINMLIGADVFWKTLCVGQIELGHNKPIMQKTRFGWVISGAYGKTQTNVKCHFSTNYDLQKQLSKFWEIEECLQKTAFSREEHECELHFLNNTTRNKEGRFVVSFPLKGSLNDLGESKNLAVKRFLALERKFQRDPDLKNHYKDFMTEYMKMDHMEVVDSSDSKIETYYMPHHGVIKADSLTTKLRVVFDASAPSTTGVSLNDLQMVGPTIQNELLSIILRFRVHFYVVSADIHKMYRMVLINPNQQSLQRIVWRDDPSKPLQSYNLKTVTYGQSASSFLAIRCLFALADEHNDDKYISDIIKNDFYVDDLLTGSNTIEGASYICQTISNILKQGCFQLRKWTSNEPQVLQNINSSELSHNILDFGKDRNAKTLGLIWNCSSDRLMYKIDTSTEFKSVTKRRILSHISQIYDPLGLLSPCTIIAKMTIQKLWLQKLSWDESLPVSMHSSWLSLERDLPNLNSLDIPRLVLCKDYNAIEIHGFSDASQSAYGGCVFVRSNNKEGEVSVNLLCAKSKVAPIKTQTLPRLELCGALVLSRLLQKVLSALCPILSPSRCILWSDSTIVLGWIGTSPHSLKTFISNRVSEIQEITEKFEWRHVPTKDNPADMLSRGVYPNQLKNANLWWQGPSWLKKDESFWPENNITEDQLPEMRDQKQTCMLIQNNDDFPFRRYSSLSKLIRVTAFILRFKSNCLKSKDQREVELYITQSEANESLLLLVKLSQQEAFPLDYASLSKTHTVHSKSKILSLNPFIDQRDLIRVGGRFNNSNFSFDKKHPMLLSHKHPLTILIFSSEHVRLLHAGPQCMLASIRDRFWPIGGRNLAKKTVRSCVRCFRANPKTINPIMGNLPRDRLILDIPFTITGVDYAGPFTIRDRKGRGSKLSKCYICLFICFATKAIHIELVSDLTSDAFVLALRRFAGRRGKPAKIYSDNGSNFVRANKDLIELGRFLISKNDQLEDTFSHEGINWKFIPVNSPHFGGLWEAGVKSIKHHLHRIMGNANLTFEEFYSLLVQVEAIVNSRPLHPFSCDPNDLNPLTPAHFLVGKPLTSVPDPDVRHIPDNRLSIYQRIQQLRQHFWDRWNKEYVSELQQRSKWRQSQQKIEENTLVLVKEDNLPPMKWCLGRVVCLHPGKDNVSRVVSIKTANGEIKRAVSRICPLPTFVHHDTI